MAETGIAARQVRPPPPTGGVEKAAILLLTLGPEAAGSVFKHLNEHEVRQLSAAIARLRSIPRDQAAAVHEEAWRWLTSREGFLVDGEQFARNLIATALASGQAPEQQAQAMRELERATKGGGDYLASSLEAVPPGVLAQVLGHEHPQVVAFVLAHLQPRQAAEVLGALPEGLAPDIVQRIAELQSVSEQVLTEVGDVLQGQVQGLGVGGGGGGGMGQSGQALRGPKLAAEIMNVIDKGLEGRVFTHLDEDAPEMAEKIRNLMFTFEDLLRLDNRAMQLVLKEVPREDLMLALKTASPSMRDKIFANISQRAAEILQDDMASMGPVRLKDVEKAQTNIVSVVRRLQDEQKIQIGGSGEDALV